MGMKRFAAAPAVALLAIAVLAATPTRVAAVQAAQSRVVSAVPATDTPNVNNGVVYAIGQSGPTVVLGGSFTSVSPPGSGTTITDDHLTAFTAGTGALVAGFAPTLDDTVTTVIPGPTSGTVYVGGDFSTIDGVHSSLALISTATGAIVPGWQSPSTNGAVNTLVLSGNRLFVGGYFTAVAGASKVGLAVLNAVSGAVTSYPTPGFTGHHNYGTNCHPTSSTICAFAKTGIKSMDINPAGTRLVAIGNFTSAGGMARDQIALLDLGASGATVDPAWATDAYTASCHSASFDTYVRDIQFSPQGSYFVVAVTGGDAGTTNKDGTQTSCDTAARFETKTTGSDVRPTWIDYTGNDSFLSVAVTGTAIYVGGHERWVNNSQGIDAAGEGAVPRPGIVALDPINGLPLAWNPGRDPRGAGAYALLATSDGLYVGSDTDYIGARKYVRKKIAFFPLAGGSTVAANRTGSLPGTVVLLGTGTTAKDARSVSWNGHGKPGRSDSLAAVDWSTARGAFEANNEVYYGDTDGNFYRRSFDGQRFGPAVSVDPYDDPAWADISTGSGQTYRGVKSSFYGEMSSLTSMFYSAGRVYYTLAGNPHMFWRWFEPDSGVMGADEFTTTDSVNWSQLAGAFLSGSTLYYADATNRSLFKVRFSAGHASGTPTMVNSSIDWASHGAFLSLSGIVTKLAVTPHPRLRQHHKLTLTAKVSLASDPSRHPAGTVRFKDGKKPLGRARVDTRTGHAVLRTKAAPPSAPHAAVLTAFFTPANGGPQRSTSLPVRVTINPVATRPHIAGKVRVAATDRCVEPRWSGERVHYSWKVGARSVAHRKSYRVPAFAYRKRLTCRATVSMGSGPKSSATSRHRTVARRAAHRHRHKP